MFELSQTNMIILLILGCAAYYWMTNQNTIMGGEMTNDNQNNEIELNNEEVESNKESEPEPKKCDTCNEEDGEHKKADNTFQPVAGSAFDTVSSF